MPDRRRRTAASTGCRMALAGAFVLSAAPLAAATPPPATTRAVPEPPRGVAGTVVSIAEDKVVLRQGDGSTIEVAMTPRWTVSRPRPGGISEVRIGDFVGSASHDLGQERGRANELRVFEPGYRPEYGTHSIQTPETSISHGFVFAIRAVAEGTELDLAYPGGRRTVLVPAGMAPTVFDLLPREAAAPGIAVTAVTRPGPDGLRRASRLTLAPGH
jgi:hypothetical protein